MSVRRRNPPPPQEIDLEATAELPVIEFDLPTEDRAGATDTFLALPVPQDTGATDFAESLREVEARLQRKSERLRQLEGMLAAAETVEKELRAQLDADRKGAAGREAESNQKLEALNQTLSDLRGQFEQRGSELSATRDELAAQRSQYAELRRDADRQANELRHHATDLADLRRRNERQVEALRHTQGHSAVFEGLIAERDDSLSRIEARHAEVLAAAATRESRLQEELRAQEKRLRAEHAARESTLIADLDFARDDSARRLADLETAKQQVVEELSLTSKRLEAAELRGNSLAAEVDAQRALVARHEEELARLRATDETARRGAEVYGEQQRRIRDLENELAEAQQSASQFEQDLNAAEDQIQRLESEARASALLLGNLQQNIARLGREDSGARPALKVVPAADQPLPERLLIGEEGGTEIRHAIGRRTTVGRTADNDIQIDVASVSRHHAVLLGSPQHCILEDLNSTNGVMVNGRRVNRQILQDGDNVTIGRAAFRFQQTA